LDVIKKKLKLPRLIHSVREAVKVGHTVKVNFIIGFPHEGFGNIFQTLWCVLKFACIGVHDCNIAIFTPYPGSELYNDLRGRDKIGKPSDNYFRSLIVQFDFTVATAYCERVSAKMLVIMRTLGQSMFYLVSYISHPSRILKLILNIRKERFQASNLFEQRISDFNMRRKMARGSK
jgi:anaerobic magnesium-protoporphyrin IX monomethyl ester cyclase